MSLVIFVNSRIQNWNEIGNFQMLLSKKRPVYTPSTLSLRSEQAERRYWIIRMGERRGLNPRVMDPQSIALIHLATSAPFANVEGLPECEQDPCVKLDRFFDWYSPY